MGFATREGLLGREAQSELVTLGNGEQVYVCEMTVGDRMAVEFALANGGDGKPNPDRVKFRAMLVCACARDEKGLPLFEPNDLAAIHASPSSLFEPIVDAAMRLNGFSEKDVEALEGN